MTGQTRQRSAVPAAGKPAAGQPWRGPASGPARTGLRRAGGDTRPGRSARAGDPGPRRGCPRRAVPVVVRADGVRPAIQPVRGPATSSGRRGRAALGPGLAARGQARYGSDPALARGAEADPGWAATSCKRDSPLGGCEGVHVDERLEVGVGGGGVGGDGATVGGADQDDGPGDGAEVIG